MQMGELLPDASIQIHNGFRGCGNDTLTINLLAGTMRLERGVFCRKGIGYYVLRDAVIEESKRNVLLNLHSITLRFPNGEKFVLKKFYVPRRYGSLASLADRCILAAGQRSPVELRVDLHNNSEND